MHRRFMKQCFLGSQDLNNALKKKEKICSLNSSIAQPVCEWEKNLYLSTYLIVVFPMREIVLFKAEGKNWGIDSVNSRWERWKG